MKTDSSIDYYAILGVDSKASDEEIKKAFRKQALLHHPDRNPGKEEEAKSRFQDVHTAYDLLSDKGRREKYDRDRQKKSTLWERSPVPPRPAPYTAASAFHTATSAFQQTQSARPPRSSASRYAAFAEPPRTPFPGTNSNAKFEDFKAFESMRGGHRPTSNQRTEPPPRQHRPPPTAQRPPASKARSRGEWDEDLAGRGNPGMFRSQSTRSPRKNGFDPHAVGGDEPGTRNASTSYNTRAERARTTESRFHASPPVSDRSPRPHSMAFDSQRFDVDESPGESYSPNRMSMPYASKPGEKTYFSTAALGRSSKSFTNMDRSASEESRKASGPGRFRSASPQARTPQPPQEETSSSGSEDETYTDSKKTSQQSAHGRRASAAPKFYGANVTVEDEAEDDPKQFSKPSRNQTWTQQSPVDGEPRSRRQYQYPPPPPPGSQFFPRPPSPRQAREHRGSVASEANGDGPPRDSAFAVGGSGPQGKRPSIFSIPSSSSSSVAPSKNESSENVNVQFAPPNWHGRFDSPFQAGNTVPSPGSSSSKVRGSPPKRPGLRPAYPSPSAARSDAAEDNLASQKMPPPPPPSQSQSQADKSTETQTQTPTSTSPSKFASEEWHAQFQNQNNWAKPGPHPPPRQMQTPKSRNLRGTQAKRATVNGQGKDNTATEDPGNDGDDEARQSGSNLETEGEMSRSASGTAMEIDTESPPGTSRDHSNTRPDGPPKTTPDQNATSPTPSSAFPRPPEPQIGLNMQHLQNVYPLNGTSAAGLDGMKADLASSLPFESGAAQEAMPMPKAQTLDLPLPPKAPVKPVRYSPPACEQYMKSFATYVREFQHFNSRMLTHFGARQSAMVDMTAKNTEAAEKGFFAMCNGAGQGLNKGAMADVAQWSWMGARSNEGYMRYMAWLEEDDRVEEHWRVAWELHRRAMKDLGEVRKVMIGLST